MTLELDLSRTYFKPHYTIGKLYTGGVYLFDTLEDRYRDLSKEAKVPGETCIPFGRYRIDLTMSTRFHRILPLLINVPHFEAIRIHGGTTDANTEGCILVGRNTMIGMLTESQICLGKLMDIFSQHAGEPAFITIRRAS